MSRASQLFRRNLLQAACVLGALAPWQVQAQTATCSPEVKAYVLEALASIQKLPEAQQAEQESALYKQYQFCAGDGTGTAAFFNAARQCGAAVSAKGSLAYEEMSCCGYDPQRRTFACPVRINRNVGFGGSPLPGSREYVMHCVYDAAAAAWRHVGTDSVHLSNSVAAPTWQFAVVANAHMNLPLVQPMDGATRRARSILSWGFRPTSCAFVPIWGNALDYRIRLDQ